MKIYPADTLIQFEFDRIIQLSADKCQHKPAREKLLKLKVIESKTELFLKLNQTDEFRKILVNGLYFPDSSYTDLQKETSLLRIQNSVLQPESLGEIRSLTDTANGVIRFLGEHQGHFPHLFQILGNVKANTEIIKIIDEIIDARNEVKSSASRELGHIRQELSSKRRESDRRFRNYVNEARKQGYLRDYEENFYNGRRVLAVLAEYKREVKGMVHGSSDTGKTTFIEPYTTIELNNEIAEFEQAEKREIFRLLKLVTDRLRPYRDLIIAYGDILTDIDFIRAKARLAADMKAILPEIQDEFQVILREARHPLLYLQNKSQNKETIPLTISLEKDHRILIISGPNAGGKSIALKTLGLLQLMLQSGFLVPLKEGSKMSLFNKFICDIGDSQSIEYELSTYSSRLLKMKYLLENSDSSTLFLIDEFGTGTDPELGGAIAEVILEEVTAKHSIGIVTTHYTNIKLLADKLEGVDNACMQFDPATLKPLYRLITGQPGSSYTFEVADRIGLPKALIQRASKKVQREKVQLNKLLSDLQKEKLSLQEKIAEFKLKEESALVVTKTFDELSEKLKEKLLRESEKAEENNRLNELGRRWEQINDEWAQCKDAAARKEFIGKLIKRLEAGRKRKIEKALSQKKVKKAKKTENIILVKKLEIKVGSKVKLLNSKETGMVEEIIKNKARVTFGSIKSIVSLENLQAVE